MEQYREWIETKILRERLVAIEIGPWVQTRDEDARRTELARLAVRWIAYLVRQAGAFRAAWRDGRCVEEYDPVEIRPFCHDRFTGPRRTLELLCRD